MGVSRAQIRHEECLSRGTIEAVYSSDGILLTEDVFQCWKEHFEELVNLNGLSSIAETQLDNDEEFISISQGEVTNS